MNTNTKSVRAAAQMKLNGRLTGGSSSFTPEDIRKVVLATIEFFGCEDVDAEAVVADLEASFQTIIGTERVLQDSDSAYEPWLDKRKASVSWRFWDRYQQYLLQEGHWPQATLDRLDGSTDQVLGLLTDRYDRRMGGGTWRARQADSTERHHNPAGETPDARSIDPVPARRCG